MADLGDSQIGIPRLLIDIHTHTYPNSDDSALSVDDLIGQAKRARLDGICLTDHDRFWDHERIERLRDEHDFLVIPGCEITTDEGHLLVYGLDDYVFGMHKAAFVSEMARRADAAMILAHPYRRVYNELDNDGAESYDRMLDLACEGGAIVLVDAIEVHNGRGSLGANAFARDVARRTGIRVAAGGDCHMAADVGTGATRFERRIRGLADFVGEIKAGRFSPAVLKTRPARRSALRWASTLGGY